MKIDNKKYARNAFYFNLCFVCDASARTVHYEPVVKKMSDFLVRIYILIKIIIPLASLNISFHFMMFQMALEVENCFLSATEDKSKLAGMLGQVMQDLNLHKMCTLTGKDV